MNEAQWKYCFLMIGFVLIVLPTIREYAPILAARFNFPYPMLVADMMIILAIVVVAYILYPLVFNNPEDF